MAYDTGPLVANLWKAEKDGQPLPPPQSLDTGQLNTVAYVISRYGRLTGTDLEHLTHSEEPWQQADAHRAPASSVRIEQDSIRSFFKDAGGPDPEQPWPDREDVATVVAGAHERPAEPARDDDLTVLRALVVRSD